MPRSVRSVTKVGFEATYPCGATRLERRAVEPLEGEPLGADDHAATRPACDVAQEFGKGDR